MAHQPLEPSDRMVKAGMVALLQQMSGGPDLAEAARRCWIAMVKEREQELSDMAKASSPR